MLARPEWSFVRLSYSVRLLAIATLLSWVLPTPSTAQTASFRSVDTNSDGVLDFDELVASFGEAGAEMLLSSTDHNGDRRITIAELRRDQSGDRAPDDDGDRPDDRDRDDDDDDDDDYDDDDDRDDDGDDDDDD